MSFEPAQHHGVAIEADRQKHRGPQHAAPGQMPPQQQMNNGPACFKLIKPTFARRYELQPNSGHGRHYEIPRSKHAINKPHLTLIPGSGDGPPVAGCYFPSFSRTFRFGLGNPAEGNVRWAEMKKHGMAKYDWSWDFTIPHTGQVVPMAWKKTHSVTADGATANPLSGKNFKLVDPHGQVMAVFTRDMLGLTAVGALQINVDLGPVFEHAVIITLVAIYDYMKRDEDSIAADAAIA